MTVAGNRSRLKGYRAERGLVKFLQAAGLEAERAPLSGALRGARFGGGFDVHVAQLFGRQFKLEVKHHANGFRRLYKWLEPVDMLIVRSNYSKPLAVVPLELLLQLATAAKVEIKNAPKETDQNRQCD